MTIPEFEKAARRRKQPELIRRQQATAATLAKFRGKKFDWRGGATCAHLARFHLTRMGRRAIKLPPFRSLLGARRTLDAQGWGTIADALDAQGLERIPPAAMRLGDLGYRASEPGAEAVGSVFVCVGGQKLLGWFENDETGGRAVVMDMSFDQIEAAWRV